MNCRGIVVTSQGNPEMCSVPVTDPGRDEVQVRMASTLVSAGTERAWSLGYPNAVPEYPYVPGYCCAGWVEKVGCDVQDLTPGDRVACYAVGIGHREVGNVPAYRVVPLPDNVSFDHGAFTSLGQTSLQGIRKCRIELGEISAFLGMGLVGIIALEFAGLNGSVCTIALDPSDARLQIASKCGADHVINNSHPGWEDAMDAASGGTGAHIVTDSTGIPAVMSTACRIASDYGRVCILGCPRGETSFDFYHLVQKKSLTVIGAHAVDSIPRCCSYPNFWTFADDAKCFLKFVSKGRFILDPMIGERVPAKNAENAYRDLILNDRDTLGMIIDWT